MSALVASPHREVIDRIASVRRHARGIGWIDAHLVHTALVHGQKLMTLDRAQASFHALASGAGPA